MNALRRLPRTLRNVWRLIFETARYAVATRRVSLLAVLVVGLLLVAVTAAAQLIAPIAIYPFV